ncbi:MAG TPA: hypothetical protein P5079_02010 [Elusimicrobiota bacterium]|nr:hypothetical protein [Elusimicrobiota bacterium]
MKRLSLIIFFLVVLGCSKSPEGVSNTATRYVDGLQADVEKAKDAAAAANKVIADTQAMMKKAGEAVE